MKYAPTSLNSEKVQMGEAGSQRGHSTQSMGKLCTRGRARGEIALRKETLMDKTKSTCSTDTKLKRISEMSRQDSGCVFKWLMPHYNTESLSSCFYELDGRKALGIDGISKDDYGLNLQENIDSLISKMKTMSYRPGLNPTNL